MEQFIFTFKKKFFFIYLLFLNIYLSPKKIFYAINNKYEQRIIKNNEKRNSTIVGVYDLNVFLGYSKNAALSYGDFVYFIFFWRY